MLTKHDWPEITDILIEYDPETLERRSVRKLDILNQLSTLGMKKAYRIVQALPAHDGYFEPRELDALFVRIHTELQRLHEEMRQGERAHLLVKPWLQTLRETNVQPPYYIVDIGCGTGYVLRWLAAYGQLGSDVKLIGCDYNRALIQAAQTIAKQESLDCEFYVANAFKLKHQAHLYLSTGVLHHFRNQALVDFFAQQTAPYTSGFLHFDIKPSYITHFGAWLFHVIRMREAIARHDGVLSAIRAHSKETLVNAARAAAPTLRIGMFDSKKSVLPILRTLHAIVGVQQSFAERLFKNLEPLCARFEFFP